MTPRALRATEVLMMGSVLLTFLGGCEGATPGLAVVRGKISYQGRPLHSGTIVFTPDAVRGGNGPLARAEIEPDGSYALQTEGRPGAAPGWHRVTVMAVESTAAPGQEDGSLMPRALLPERYRDPERSGLAREIRAGQENWIVLDLD